jgi:hypothetical protein
MNMHKTDFWVGGYEKVVAGVKEWHLCHPISYDAIQQSLDSADTVEDFDHRMKLLWCVAIYDDWYDRVREENKQ